MHLAALDGRLDVHVRADVHIACRTDGVGAKPLALCRDATGGCLGGIVGGIGKIAVVAIHIGVDLILLGVDNNAARGLDVHVVNLNHVLGKRRIRLVNDVREGGGEVLTLDIGVHIARQIQAAVTDFPIHAVLLEVGKRRRVGEIVFINHFRFGRCGSRGGNGLCGSGCGGRGSVHRGYLEVIEIGIARGNREVGGVLRAHTQTHRTLRPACILRRSRDGVGVLVYDCARVDIGHEHLNLAVLDGCLDVHVRAEIHVAARAYVEVAQPLALRRNATDGCLGRVVGGVGDVAVVAIHIGVDLILLGVQDDTARGLDVHVVHFHHVLGQRRIRLINDVREGGGEVLSLDGGIHIFGQIQAAVANLPLHAVLLEVGKRRRIGKVVFVNHFCRKHLHRKQNCEHCAKEKECLFHDSSSQNGLYLYCDMHGCVLSTPKPCMRYGKYTF